jgi:hypothetical protein
MDDASRAPGAPVPAPAIPKAFSTPPPVGASGAQAVPTRVQNPVKPSPASPAQPPPASPVQPAAPTGAQNPVQPPLASAMDVQQTTTAATTGVQNPAESIKATSSAKHARKFAEQVAVNKIVDDEYDRAMTTQSRRA